MGQTPGTLGTLCLLPGGRSLSPSPLPARPPATPPSSSLSPVEGLKPLEERFLSTDTKVEETAGPRSRVFQKRLLSSWQPATLHFISLSPFTLFQSIFFFLVSPNRPESSVCTRPRLSDGEIGAGSIQSRGPRWNKRTFGRTPTIKGLIWSHPASE